MLNGDYCSFFIVGQTEEYILYSVPILLNGTETNLRVAWMWWEEENEDANGEFVVMGAWDGIDTGTGMSSRDIRPVADGDVIVPVFYAFDEDSEETLYGEEIVASGGVSVEYGELEPGEYWYSSTSGTCTGITPPRTSPSSRSMRTGPSMWNKVTQERALCRWQSALSWLWVEE